MPTLQADYFAAYRSLTLTRDTNGELAVGFHSNGGPFMFGEWLPRLCRTVQTVARRSVGGRPHEINASQE